jgi:hypothetical protein
MMDQQPHPAVAAVSAHFARQGEARSITCAQRRSAHHVRGWDGHCFIFPVASDLPPSSSPERRDHRRQEQAPWLTRQNPASSFPSSRGYHPSRRSFRQTDGRQRRTARPRAVGDSRRLLRRRIPSAPSRPTHAPSRGLLLLLLQQQLDALSDERRGLPVPRVRDQLPHELPRRLVHAEGDDS